MKRCKAISDTNNMLHYVPASLVGTETNTESINDKQQKYCIPSVHRLQSGPQNSTKCIKPEYHSVNLLHPLWLAAFGTWKLACSWHCKVCSSVAHAVMRDNVREARAHFTLWQLDPRACRASGLDGIEKLGSSMSNLNTLFTPPDAPILKPQCSFGKYGTQLGTRD